MGLFQGLAAPLAGMTAATFGSLAKKPESPYPPVPSLADPAIWGAGTSAARRQPPASGQPQGLTWATAQQLTPFTPGLIGR